MDFAAIDRLVKQFGEDVVKSMQDELKKNGSVATGELLNSIHFTSKVDADKILIQFLSEDYAKYIEQGRKKGTFPPISKIEKWCAVKGIPEKAAFPIARKIYRFGLKPKPFFLKGLNKKKQDFTVALIKLYEKEIIIDIKKEFANGYVKL